MPQRHEQVIRNEIVLSEEDRITYIYARDMRSGIVTEVITVSYDLCLKGEWLTIIRHDSTHWYLHRHTRVSLQNPAESVSLVTEQGTHQTWLTWAVEETKQHFLVYKREFMDRSQPLDNGT